MRTAFFLLALFSGLALAGGAANQDEADEFNRCVEIEVDGVAAPSYSCLTQKLRPTAKRPQVELNGGNVTRRPGNQMGLFNQAATSHRMGNAFGNSVLPQRPDRSSSP